MPSVERISALRGMRDVFSEDFARYRAIQACLERHLRLRNYVAVDTPILENTELYLRKSGEDIAARLYEFDFKSRRLSLRPELTASILRAYVERLQDEPLPLRLQYSGPVFRYEKPQQHRFRQFSLSGAELVGAKGARADAEILHLACSGLEALGISDYSLVIANTALLDGFLNRLGLRKQLVNFLLRNMENLRKRGPEALLGSLARMYPDLSGAGLPSQASGDSSQQLITALRQMSDEEARQAVADFLHSLNIHVAGNRAESDIIEGLLRKIREDEQAPKLRQALDFMARLARLSGCPEEVMPEALALAEEYKLDRQALSSLQEALACLDDYGERSGALRLDFGMHRGLHYYTGIVFELHGKSASGEPIQLCGGGRYDNLISILGGSEATPALGFAYGLERLASALPETAHRDRRPLVVALPLAEADYAFALGIADELRGHGIVVEVSVDQRSLRRSLKHADRRGAALVIIIGENERRQQAAILRDMLNHQERLVERADLAGVAVELLKAHE